MSLFADAAGRGVDIMFRTFGVAGTYTPPAGDPVPGITIILRRPDAAENFGRQTGVLPTHIVDVQAQEVAAPEDGGTFTVTDGGLTLKVQGQPVRNDTGRLVWRCDTVAVAP